MLTHFSLFSGIGGVDLAAEWAGFTTVGQVEYADYPTKVLEKHWPDVPRWRDIRSVTRESFAERTGLRTVDLISGGFPCQPFSVAGKQKGKGDDRYLWPEMLRVIREIKPTWVLGENVPGILRIAGKTVCEDLEREGYAVTVFSFEAAAVGAPHRRDRVFFVANANGEGLQGQRREFEFVPKQTSKQSTSDCCQEAISERWKFEPGVGRVVNGIPNRVDRLKCLGNAVVPQQVYPTLKAIAEIEKGKPPKETEKESEGENNGLGFL